MGNVSPPTSFPPTSIDIASLTQSTSTPSLPDKPSTASSEDNSATIVTIFKKKHTKKPTKENLSELVGENKIILEPSLKIDEVIKQFSSNKNNIEVVSLSTADFDQMLQTGKVSKDSSRIQQ